MCAQETDEGVSYLTNNGFHGFHGFFLLLTISRLKIREIREIRCRRKTRNLTNQTGRRGFPSQGITASARGRAVPTSSASPAGCGIPTVPCGCPSADEDGTPWGVSPTLKGF